MSIEAMDEELQRIKEKEEENVEVEDVPDEIKKYEEEHAEHVVEDEALHIRHSRAQDLL